MAQTFRRAAVLGTGLIGGSFALALRQAQPETRIVGWDKEEVLREAAARSAIHETTTDLAAALRGAELVFVALPVGLTIELLPQIVQHADPAALVTDSGSTKAVICRRAAEIFTTGARFLGGHPLAGKETSGIAAADAGLFRGAKYVLVGEEADADARVARFVALLRQIGAEPVLMDAETHDWAVAITSHLPQLAAVALARVVYDETDETGLPIELAGPGLRDTLRLAGSPHAVWRDICLTNTENIARALDRLSQAVEHLRTHLASRQLEDEFAAANEVYKILRNLR